MTCDPRMCNLGPGEEMMHGGSAIGSNMSGGGGGAITLAAILSAIFGDDTSKIPNSTYGDQIVESGSTNTGGDQLPETLPNNTADNSN